MNTENNPNPMNLDELFASPATTVPEPSPAAEPHFSPVSEPAAPKPDNIVDLFMLRSPSMRTRTPTSFR